MLRLILTLLIFFISPYKSYSAEVMIIGDSLSVGQYSDEKNNTRSGLGRELGKLLEKQGHKLNVVASCGSSPLSYTTGFRAYKTPCGYYQKYSGQEKIDMPRSATPKLSEIANNSKIPDLMVIQQGTNLYPELLLGNKNNVKRHVKELLKEYDQMTKTKVPKSKCLWIGPPAILKISVNGVKRDVTKAHTDQMVELIQQGIKESGVECKFTDSRPVTRTQGLSKDGTHYQTGQIDEWIDHSYKEALVSLKELKGVPVEDAKTKDESSAQLNERCDTSTFTPVINEDFYKTIEKLRKKLLMI